MSQFSVKDKITAVELVLEVKKSYPTRSICSIAEEMGVSAQNLYNWIKSYDSGSLNENNTVACSRKPASMTRMVRKTSYKVGDKIFKTVGEARKGCIEMCGGIQEHRKMTNSASRAKAEYHVQDQVFSSLEDATNYCIEKAGGIFKVKNVFA